jgi:hypothetical protein
LTALETTAAVDLFCRALSELGLTIPDKRTAALQYARCVSKLIVSGEVTPYHGAKSLWIASLAVAETSFHDLDPFIYAASEYEDRPQDKAFFDESIVTEAQRVLG